MDLDEANALCRQTFAELVGLVFVELAPGRAVARLDVRPELLAPNGYLHGSAVAALAETACGMGTVCTLGGRLPGFTTIDLACNFVGTARDGAIVCEASCAHAGRSTQVWDAHVRREDDDRSVAIFRCTQLILG